MTVTTRDEEETAKQETKGKEIFRETSNKESQQGEEGQQGVKTSQAATPFDLQELRKTLQAGNVNYLSTHDILSAALLLSSVTPGGVQDRAAQKNQKVNTQVDELREDPVLVGLWSLTMKIRSGVEHADEILKVHGMDRLLSVMKDCNLAKYHKDHPDHVPTIASSNPGEKMSEAQLTQAVRLRRDIFDVVMVIAALHELCRFRSGCVALANHDECLVFLWNLPFDHVVASVTETMNAHNFSSVGPIDWGNPYNYSVGMVEQGLIDTFGRLLNGLDEHPSLRHKVAAMMMRYGTVDALEARMQLTLLLLSNGRRSGPSRSEPSRGYPVQLVPAPPIAVALYQTTTKANNMSKPGARPFDSIVNLWPSVMGVPSIRPVAETKTSTSPRRKLAAPVPKRWRRPKFVLVGTW